MDSYFKENSLVQHQLTSFDLFVEDGMQRVVDEAGSIEPDIIPEGMRTISIKFGKIWIEKPAVREADGVRRSLTPMEARLRDLTYEAPIFLEMWVSKDGVDEEKQVVNIGNMPIMVRSKYCVLYGKSKSEMIQMGEDPEDTGGYFIINGTERVVVAMEDLAPNKIFAEKATGPYPFIAKVFSDDGQYKIPHLLEKGKDGVIYVSFTRIKRIPFAVMMKALGITNDKEIMGAVSENESLQSDLYINLYETAETATQEEAVDLIGKKMGVSQEVLRRRRALDNIDNFFLPHIGHDEKARIMKAYFLAKAVKKLLLVSYGKLEEDDKDHYSNKRVQLVGDLMESLFRFSFKMLTGDVKYNFERLVKRGKMPSLVRATRSKLLTSRIRSVLSTGEWIGGRHGISQHLDRLNVFASLSHLRRIVSPLRTSREAFEARDLHPTHWGRLCSAETPEGPSIGLRKNLAILSEISPKVKSQPSKLIKKFETLGLKVVQ
jgi:DNA-directed RNA polymerase beta subunit